MATITYVFTINHVAEMLEEDPELLQAIVGNSDNLTYGNIISVVHGDDKTITALTDDGIDELNQCSQMRAVRPKPGTTSSTALSTTKTSSLASRRNLRGNNRPVTHDRAAATAADGSMTVKRARCKERGPSADSCCATFRLPPCSFP